jgi:hypothetical protein
MSNNAGREISSIKFPDSPMCDPHVRSTPEARLMWNEEYHGDHDMAWVVQLKGTVELARFNPRYIETIVWATPETECGK